MKTIQRFTLLFLTCLVCACGAVIDPASLKHADPTNVAELSNGYSYISAPAGVYDSRVKYELVAGNYVADIEDDAGTYFRGPAGCVGVSLVSSSNKDVPINKVIKYEGGVFVPRNKEEPAKIYFYRGVAVATTPSASATNDMAMRAAPGASIGQSALGGVIASAIIDASIKAERGKIGYMPSAKDDSLRSAIVFRKL